MFDFWILSALFALVACLFVILPYWLFSKQSTSKYDNVDFRSALEEQNVASYQEKLRDLTNELDSALISSEEFETRKKELEIALLNDVSMHHPGAASSNADGYTSTSSHVPSFVLPLVIFSLLIMVGGSYWLYTINGFQNQVKQYHAMNFDQEELEKAKELAQQGDMSALLKQLYDKLKAAPDNLEGWQLLARSAMNVQAYPLAVEAYKQIVRILESQDSNPAAVYGLLAQAYYYQAQGVINSETQRALDRAMSLDNNELNSLGLLAIDAFSNNRLAEARDLWRKILDIYPEHPARASIEAGIQRVSATLGDSAPMSQDELIKTQVEVTVSIDPSVTALVEPEDTVFILAKQVEGKVQNSAIPLAVSRFQVKDLPVTVILDDTKAMAPMAKLSMAARYMVIARISKSGVPTAQAGDFEAVSADLSSGSQTKIDLLIHSELK